MAVRRAAAALAALTLCAAPAAARAATITVTTEGDTKVAGGECSLREAVIAADFDSSGSGCTAGAGDDTIELPAGFYALQIRGAVDNVANTGDLDVTQPLVLRGEGAASTTIAGSGIDRVIDLRAGSLRLEGVTITGGHAPDGADGPDATGTVGAAGGGTGEAAAAGDGSAGSPGGGIQGALGTTLELDGVTVTANRAGDGGDGGTAFAGDGGSSAGTGGAATGGDGSIGGFGGGIATAGSLTVTNSTISGNSAGDGGDGGRANGGKGGSATTTGGTGGAATGGAGSEAGSGGGIASSGILVVTGSKVVANLAGRGGLGGQANGGDGGATTASGTAGTGGAATNGPGDDGGDGGGIHTTAATTVTDTTVRGNSAGDGGPSGQSFGGAGGDATSGGSGGTGGAAGLSASGNGGQGGGLNAGTTTVNIARSSFESNSAGSGPSAGDAHAGTGGHGNPGPGGAGGNATGAPGPLGGVGGGLAGGAAVTITNSTFTGNRSGAGGQGGNGIGGPGQVGIPPGNPGIGIGANGGNASGGAAAAGTPTIVHSTLAGNTAPAAGGDAGAGIGGPGSSSGSAGTAPNAAALDAGVKVTNTIVAANLPVNCRPGVTDGGHNITFPGTTCPGTSADPLLGPLADNGGPTRSLALLAGSPALDAVPATGAGCEAVDQRGMGRPVGAGCDIGAYEAAPPTATTDVASDVLTNAATLHGTVDPNLRATTVHFEFGPTTAYGSTTPDQTVSGDGPQAVAAAITGLDAGATIHYRVVATSPDGSATGDDQTFTTVIPPGPPGPPAPTFAGVTIKKQSVKVKKGVARIRVSCPAAAVTACAGKLTLRGVGSKKFSIAAGKTAKVAVKLSKKARTKLRRKHKIKTTATALAHDAQGGADVKKTARVTLKR